jgi:hypothetical protein
LGTFSVRYQQCSGINGAQAWSLTFSHYVIFILPHPQSVLLQNRQNSSDPSFSKYAIFPVPLARPSAFSNSRKHTATNRRKLQRPTQPLALFDSPPPLFDTSALVSKNDLRRQTPATAAILGHHSHKKIKMKQMIFLGLFIAMLASSCSLTSNTTIQPKDSFVLGNNEHGSFKVKLKNVGTQNLEVYQASIAGGRHSGQTVKPQQRVTVNVASNTALVIGNASTNTASVNLKVTGDVGLSMGYQQ